MNIFKENDGFLGTADTGQMNDELRELFALAREIRRRLGGHGYYLDGYISRVLEGVSRVPASVIAELGFMSGSDLRGLIGGILRSETKDSGHPLYEKAKRYIDSHPLPYEEHYTKLDIYYLALYDDFLTYAVREFSDQENMEMVSVDTAHLDNLYNKMSERLGGSEQLDRLAQLLRQRFCRVSVTDVFVQGLTADLLLSLIRRDEETSRQIFQLRLDEPDEHTSHA